MESVVDGEFRSRSNTKYTVGVQVHSCGHCIMIECFSPMVRFCSKGFIDGESFSVEDFCRYDFSLLEFHLW